MTIVLDTNVLVSGIINPLGAPGRIVDLLRGGVITLVVDDRILFEYRDVLQRPQLTRYFAKDDIHHIVEYLYNNSERVIPLHACNGLPDPKDAPFAEVAIFAKVPLVSGNAKHFPLGICGNLHIMSPADFMRQYKS